MVSRTATSIMLLAALVAGMATPAGACALMCVRHQRVESQRHCGQPPDAMPGMVHDHAAMSHMAVEAMSPVVVSSPSCQMHCFTAERLTVSRKTVLQVTPVCSSAVALEITARCWKPDFAKLRRMDGTPPSPFSVHAASFTILRI